MRLMMLEIISTNLTEPTGSIVTINAGKKHSNFFHKILWQCSAFNSSSLMNSLIHLKRYVLFVEIFSRHQETLAKALKLSPCWSPLTSVDVTWKLWSYHLQCQEGNLPKGPDWQDFCRRFKTICNPRYLQNIITLTFHQIHSHWRQVPVTPALILTPNNTVHSFLYDRLV